MTDVYGFLMIPLDKFVNYLKIVRVSVLNFALSVSQENLVVNLEYAAFQEYVRCVLFLFSFLSARNFFCSQGSLGVFLDYLGSLWLTLFWGALWPE